MTTVAVCWSPTLSLDRSYEHAMRFIREISFARFFSLDTAQLHARVFTEPMLSTESYTQFLDSDWNVRNLASIVSSLRDTFVFKLRSWPLAIDRRAGAYRATRNCFRARTACRVLFPGKNRLLGNRYWCARRRLDRLRVDLGSNYRWEMRMPLAWIESLFAREKCEDEEMGLDSPIKSYWELLENKLHYFGGKEGHRVSCPESSLSRIPVWLWISRRVSRSDVILVFFSVATFCRLSILNLILPIVWFYNIGFNLFYYWI